MLGCHSKVNLSLKMETITYCGSLLLACVMINGIINKEHQIYVETLVGKNHINGTKIFYSQKSHRGPSGRT